MAVVQDLFSVDLSEKNRKRATHADPRAIYHNICVELYGHPAITQFSSLAIKRERTSGYNAWNNREKYMTDKSFKSNYLKCFKMAHEIYYRDFIGINPPSIENKTEDSFLYKSRLLNSQLNKFARVIQYTLKFSKMDPRVSEILRKDAIQYQNLGTDSTEDEILKVKHQSFKYYNEIAEIDPDMGEILLKSFDGPKVKDSHEEA